MPNKRQREGLLNHADDARQSRTLARIHVDCPVDFDPESMRFRGASRERCFDLFTRLGFRTLVMDFAPTAQTSSKRYRAVDTIEGVAALAADLRAAGRFALRVLPDAPAAMRASIVGLSFSTAPHEARYVALVGSGLGFDGGLDAREALAVLKPVLEDPLIRKIGHDLKFDSIVLARHGVNMQGLETDTMIASYLVDANRSSHPLEELALEHTGYKAMKEEDVCGRGAKSMSFAQIPVQAALDYAGERSDLALQLAPALRAIMDRDGLTPVYDSFEHPLIPVLMAIEQAGVRIDRTALASQAQRIDEELYVRARRIYELRAKSSTSTPRRSWGRSSSTRWV